MTEPTIKATPGTLVPNVNVILVGSGFKPSSRITGSLGSTIDIAGISLMSPDVEYPIQVANNGFFVATIRVPQEVFESQAFSRECNTEGTECKDIVDLVVTDDRGVSSSTVLELVRLGARVSSEAEFPGETIELHGFGFRANNQDDSNIINRVTVEYLSEFEDYYISSEVGRVEVDDTGQVALDLEIPFVAFVPSTNQVILTSSTGETLKLWHRIPTPTINIYPNEFYPGDEINIVVEGLGENIL